MADTLIPVKAKYTGTDVTSLGEYATSEKIPKLWIDSDLADKTADNSWTGSLDLNTANNFKYTPAATPDTLEFTNETAGQSGFITVINASGHTIATGAEVKKSSTWDVSTAGTYLVSYYSDGTNVYVSASAALA